MSAFLEGLGKVFGKVADQFQGRIERLKNEREKLLNERQRLLDGAVSTASSVRVFIINNRVREINQAISSKASD